MSTASQLPIDSSASALDMANAMFGTGIKLQSASYTGATSASGIYSDGDAVAPDLTPSDSGVILSTGRAEDVTNAAGDVNTSSFTTTMHATQGDSDLDEVSGQTTFDAAVFEAAFVPQGDTLTMQVTFSSEEYLEYVDSGFNDAVGVFVNGAAAQLTVGSGDITINNINDQSNENLYLDNPASGGTYNSEMDGLTVTLTLKAPVKAGEVNTLKIGIADAGDSAFDSNLLIAGDSIQTALVAGDDEIQLGGTAPETVDLLANDSSTAGGTLTITKINGQAVKVGDSVTLPTGETIELTETGMVIASPDGDQETKTFSYQVEDGAGNTDTAFVTVTTAPPCFVAGTRIATPGGDVPVERLRAGDLVTTLDRGPQPLRWTGAADRTAQGRDAPVAISAGALGSHEAQELSPNHRVLLRSAASEMLFGAAEILVKAKDLENGTTIRRREDGAPVSYVHLLFDQHEIVVANGLPSESYHPGTETLDSFDAEAVAELRRLFPDLFRPWGIADFGPAARRSLRGFEARALRHATDTAAMQAVADTAPRPPRPAESQRACPRTGLAQPS